MIIFLAIITGALVSFMIFANGTLSALSAAIPSLFIIHLAGISGTAATSFIHPQSGKDDTKSPSWFLTAGLLGIPIVLFSNLLFSVGGVVLTLTGTLAGQTIGATLLESFDHFRTHKQTPVQKYISLGLIVPGSVVVGVASGIPWYWIILAWIPGVILMFQNIMNTKNMATHGRTKMLFAHYGGPLVVLCVLLLLPSMNGPLFTTDWLAIPHYYLWGGGIASVVIVWLSSYLFKRAGAMKVVLAVFTGQTACGMIIDRLNGIDFNWIQITALLIVLAGLVTGELEKKETLVRN